MTKNKLPDKQPLSKKAITAIAIALSILMLVLAFWAGYFVRYGTEEEINKNFSWLIDTINSNYCVYDDNGNLVEFNASDYSAALIEGLLDDYSEYYTAEEYAEDEKIGDGQNYNFGMSFLGSDTIIFKVYGNSPAYKAGILKGDKIVAIEVNSVKTELSTYSGLKKILNSAQNDTPYTFYIERNGVPLDFTIQKASYARNYVFCYTSNTFTEFTGANADTAVTVDGGKSELGSDTGYIVFSGFSGNAYAQFKGAMNYLSSEGKTKLILDLRDNGGGYLDILDKIASYLVFEDGNSTPTVAKAVYKNGNASYYKSTGDRFDRGLLGNISVIANDQTASASECLIGAMLDYGTLTKEKLIITKKADGTATTYGKGIMQNTFVNLLSGEALKLTVAYVYWPKSNTSIHNVGITTTTDNSVLDSNAFARAIEVLG